MRIRPIITYIFVRNRRVSTGYLCADTQGFIYCRITVRGKKQEFATGIALLYGEWDIAAHRMHGKSVAAKQANEALVKLEDRLNDLAADIDRQNRIVTARAIYCLYQNNGATLNLLDLYGTFLAERKTLIGVEISEASYKVSAWRQQVLLAFLSAKKLTDLRPEEFTHNLGDKFIQWGLIEKSYKRSNVNKALQNVVQCLRWGVRRELLDKNPMELYRYKTPARAEIKYLNVEELRALSTQPILTSCLDRVRDCFVFQCWTGLAYADLAVLNVARDAHFHRDKTTNTLRRVLHITRAKSTMQQGYECVIPLLPEAERLLAKYEDELPVPSNQVYNRQLKEVGQLCGLEAAKMTSHVGRKTAGVMMLNLGIRLETVSKFLGHSSVKMTEKLYAKILDTTVIDDFERLFGVVNGGPAPSILPAPPLSLALPPMLEEGSSSWRRPPPVTSYCIQKGRAAA